jgi:hypothetical protein
MSLDEDGYEFTYWPITGLIEGGVSETITFKETTPVPQGFLSATYDARMRIWARRKGVGASYVNINTSPIDLSGMPAGDTEFEAYAEAVAGTIADGMEVVTAYVTVARKSPAGWSV